VLWVGDVLPCVRAGPLLLYTPCVLCTPAVLAVATVRVKGLCSLLCGPVMGTAHTAPACLGSQRHHGWKAVYCRALPGVCVGVVGIPS
jgi:hypothetical protein